MDDVLAQVVLPLRDVWTIADLEGLDVEDRRRYEIVDGALVVSPSARGDHEIVSMRITLAVAAQLPSEFVLVGPLGVDLGSSYLIPDLLIAREDAIRGRAHLGAGDVALAIEIESPGSVSMDRLVKPAKYAAAGIAHYWRVETDPVSLTAYRLTGGAYAELGTWAAGRLAQVDAPFPIALDLARLLPS